MNICKKYVLIQGLFIFISIFLSNCTVPERSVKSSSEKIVPEMPYIQVMGVAQDAGYPQAGCEKSCCKRVWNGEVSKRHVSSLALVNPATKQYWIFDATPDFGAQLHGLQDISSMPSGIFLTHGHIGHYTGLMQLGREVIGAKEMKVYSMPRMVQLLTNHAPWSQLVSLKNIALQPMQAQKAVELGNDLQVTPFIVPHRDEFTETVGYEIQVGAKRVIFIPDIDKWEKWDKPLAEIVENVDALYLDATFFDGDELPGRDMREIPHPFVVETMALLDSLPKSEKQKVRFIHLNHTNPLLDRNSVAYKTVLDKGFRIAEEGERYRL